MVAVSGKTPCPGGDGRPDQARPVPRKVEAHLGKPLAQEELEWEVLVPWSYM